MKKVSDGIDKLEWDMLYLGWWIGFEDDEWNENIEQEYLEKGLASIARVRAAPSFLGGFHGVIINKTMFKFLSELPPVSPLDGILNHNFHDGPYAINSYYIVPKIIHDKGIFSECEQSPCPRKHI